MIQTVRFDQTNSSPARLAVLDPTLCETRRPNVRSPLGGGILNLFLRKHGASKGPLFKGNMAPEASNLGCSMNGMMYSHLRVLSGGKYTVG